ncbi:MAG: hypothetical protein R3C08_13540 [Hyphomonas sp.]
MGLDKWTLEHEPEPAGPVAVGAVSGAFFLIHSADFRKLDGFDEAYFLHVEDVDLAGGRAIEAGGSVIYQPAAGALHYGQTSRRVAPRGECTQGGQPQALFPEVLQDAA